MAWRLPAEWEPQQSIWLVWPRDPVTWPERVAGARDAFVACMAALAPQRVDLAVHPELEQEAAEATRSLTNVHPHPVEHQDSWIRDYGPLTLVHGKRHKGIKFRFDAWGGKYDSLQADDEVPRRLARQDAWPVPFDEVDFVLEGGAVETDGRGTFLATESVCEGRGQDPVEFEHVLRQHLGAKHVIWLGEGIEGDDTDGHIDTLTRFVAPGHVVSAEAPKGHPDHEALAANLARLKQAKDARGKRLRIQPLPAPEQQATDDGMPLPAGYANFLIGNTAVLVPAYGGRQDGAAVAALEPFFPGRQVVPIDHRDLIWGMGGIHCLSMQVPS